MNNTRELNTYTSSPSSTSTPNLDTYMEGILASGAIIALIAIVVFIIWIWSMLSMIGLNTKFNAFYEEYKRKEFESIPTDEDDPITHSELVIEPLNKSTDESTEASWINKKPSFVSIVILSVLFLVLCAVVYFALSQ